MSDRCLSVSLALPRPLPGVCLPQNNPITAHVACQGSPLLSVEHTTPARLTVQVSMRLANAGLPLSCGSGNGDLNGPSSPLKMPRVPVEDHLKKLFRGMARCQIQVSPSMYVPASHSVAVASRMLRWSNAVLHWLMIQG